MQEKKATNENTVHSSAFRAETAAPPSLKVEKSAAPHETLSIPSQYEVLEKVSEGGMGVIYKARHRFTGGQVAVKLLHHDLTHDQEALKRFAFEARAATSLEHPNIIKIHDFGISESQVPYLIMDWVDGIGMAKKIKRDGPMNPEEAISVVLQTAQALSHAHEHKVIHRDLKPENLMLTRDHHGKTAVRVVDFGIAKALTGNESLPEAQNLTQTGTIIGSPFYMSPEQGLGRVTDERSDIYSLGCVMYYALTGRTPFGGSNFVQTIFQHVNEPVPQLEDAYRSFPEALQAIVATALAKDPDNRYQTMTDFADDLERFASGNEVVATLLPSPKKMAPPLTKAKMVAMFFASFAVFYAFIMLVQNLLKM